ncbi:MAG TPA: hypothetical protein VMB74_14445 [Streptosporangiaceae bacterium]|nr:hypothetical protein [Streptosporangiaceae bacterium]
MSYQPYPTGGGSNQMAERPPAPPSIQTAIKFMYAGAALSAVSLIVGLATIGSLKSAIKSADPSYTASQIHAAEVVGVSTVVIFGLLGIGLWIWMARMNGAGKPWARVVASVLFGISTLELLLGGVRANSVFNLLFEGLVWLIGLGAIIFLYRRDSSEYFNASRVR